MEYLKDLIQIKTSIANKVIVDYKNKKTIIISPNSFVQAELKKKYLKNIEKKLGQNIEFHIYTIRKNDLNISYKKHSSCDWLLQLLFFIYENYDLNFFGTNLNKILEIIANNAFWIDVKIIRKKWSLPDEPLPEKYEINYRKIQQLRIKRHPQKKAIDYFKKYCANYKKLAKLPKNYKEVLLTLYDTKKDYDDVDLWTNDINELIKKYSIDYNLNYIIEGLIIYNSIPLGEINSLEYVKNNKKNKRFIEKLIIQYYYSIGFKKPKLIRAILLKELNIELSEKYIKTIACREKRLQK